MLSRESLFTLEKYAEMRDQFREDIMAHKRNRRLALGTNATLYFEDRMTMQYQVQEMLRIEKIFDAAGIQEELDAIAGRSASISSIYITLTRLETKGFVTSELGSPGEQRGGRPRRYFGLEPAGLAALREARERLTSMWTGLEGELESA